MCRQNRCAAGFQMRLKHSFKNLLARGIQVGRRLIQQPQLRVPQRQPRQRHATLLPGRQASARVAADRSSTGPRHPARDLQLGIASRRAQRAGEAQVFERGEIRLQRGVVAQVGQVPVEGIAVGAHGLPVPAASALLGVQEAGEAAQQRGLAGAVGPEQLQRRARRPA